MVSIATLERTWPTPAVLHVTKAGYIDNDILSNMQILAVPISCWGREFDCVEKPYQAAKNPAAIVTAPFLPEPMMILDAMTIVTPGQSKRLGRSIIALPDWEDVKLGAMWGCLLRKFAPGRSEHRWLLGTLWPLVEYTNWGDRIWGAVVAIDRVTGRTDGIATGSNLLGRSLTLMRDTYRAGGAQPDASPSGWQELQAQLLDRFHEADLKERTP